MVRVQGKARNFREFVCLYNIFTRIQQCTKREETMSEFMKHKKDLVILKISKDEAITVYTLSVVVPSIFGDKITTTSDIYHLPTYGKWIEKSLQRGFRYDLEKMLDPVHQYIK